MGKKLKLFKNNFAKLTLFLFLFQLILFNNINVFAATTTSSPAISYSVNGEAKVGSTIEIAINIANVTNLYGGSIDFVYDNNLIELQSITKGNIFGSNEVLTPLGANGKLSKGSASFAISLKGNKNGVTSNNGTLAIIKAKILKEGSINLKTTNSNTSNLSLSSDTIRVKLADSNSKPITYTYTSKEITLTKPLTIDLKSNVSNALLGESINFTATSNLGTSAEYSFQVFVDNAWKEIQTYSSKNTLTYTATKSGGYKIKALVRDKNNNSNSISKELSFTINDKATISSLSASKSTSTLGEEVTFTAKSNLGSNAQYSFSIYADNAWKEVQTYSTKNTFSYKAPKAGSYKVKVLVRDKNKTSNSASKELSFTVNSKASVSSLSASKSTSALGESVTFTAKSNLGSNAQYSFSIYADNAWKEVQTYSTKNTFSYKASKAGSYKVKVLARDKNNTSNSASKELSFTVNSKASVSSLSASKSTSTLGENVTFTASSNLGSNAQYSFSIYANNAWKEVQSYSSKNTFSYKAPKVGSYKVKVLVRDKNNTSNSTSKELSFTVTNKATISLSTSKSTSTLGENVTFTASSNLGNSAQYKFLIYVNKAWKEVQNYSSKNTFSYKAPKAGSYKVKVLVRDKNNTSNSTSKELSFTVTNKATVSLSASKTVNPLGKAATFTASSNLGNSAQYSFYIYINKAWKEVQKYSSKNTLSYTAPKAGSYKVKAVVRDKNNTSNSTSKEISFTVK